MDIQTALTTAVKCLIRGFFGYKPDWIKCFDRSTRLGSDRITEKKFWTGSDPKNLRFVQHYTIRLPEISHKILSTVFT